MSEKGEMDQEAKTEPLPNKETAASCPARPLRRFRGWRGWLLRLSLCILSPILFFGLLEAGLRLGGYGHPTGFFLGPDAHGDYTTNFRFGWRFFPRSLARTPQPCTLSARPAGSVRIFILGESAAMGTPDPSFNFGRILAVMLRQQYPGVQFEVVNGAMTAINSHVVREIARDCAARQPDLFVVYMGNNEVIGPYGPGTVFQQSTPSLAMVRAGLWVKSTRCGQLLGDVVGRFRGSRGAPDRWRGIEMFLNNTVAADDPRLGAVYDNFQRNLTDVCGIARRAGSAVVLSTVAVNLRDCPPLASSHRSNLSPEDLAQWESLYKAGGESEAGNRWREAIEQYAAAAKIDDRFAELQFRIARCLIKTGSLADARERFELARDLDVLRFRADTRMNAVVRRVAAEQVAAGVRLADAERALAENDPDGNGIPGGKLFYEHVHLTFDGDYLLARTVFDQVCASLPQLAGLAGEAKMPSRQRCAELLALTPWDEYQSAAAMVDMTSRRPFVNQLDYDLRQAAARRRRNELLAVATTSAALEAAWKTYEAAIAASPDDWRLHHHFGRLAMQRGRPNVAVEQFRIALERDPGDDQMHCELGAALAARGDADEAVAQYLKALEIDPDCPQAYYNLGVLLAGRGVADEAIARYQKALEIEPDYAAAHYNLGVVLAGRGEVDEAMAHYRKALDVNPDYAEAHINLAIVLAGRGDVVEAISHYRKALEIRPDMAEAHFNFGVLLAGRGEVQEAIVHYRKALEIRPDMAEARFNLGAVLAGRGEVKEAIAQYRKALEIKPDVAKTYTVVALAVGPDEVDEAVALYRQVLEIKPDDADTHFNLGVVLGSHGRVDEAVAHFRRALEIKPDFAEAHVNLGVMLAGRNEIDEAIAHYQKALDLASLRNDKAMTAEIGARIRRLKQQ
jgi:tetratricopeptide (TPR) repeat protein